MNSHAFILETSSTQAYGGTSGNPIQTKSFSVDEFAYVPARLEPWSVVLDVNEKFVGLSDFEIESGGFLIERRFLHSAAIPGAQASSSPVTL